IDNVLSIRETGVSGMGKRFLETREGDYLAKFLSLDEWAKRDFVNDVAAQFEPPGYFTGYSGHLVFWNSLRASNSTSVGAGDWHDDRRSSSQEPSPGDHDHGQASAAGRTVGGHRTVAAQVDTQPQGRPAPRHRPRRVDRHPLHPQDRPPLGGPALR